MTEVSPPTTASLLEAIRVSSQPVPREPPTRPPAAGFWHRTAAYVLDTTLAALPAGLLASWATHAQSSALLRMEPQALTSSAAARIYLTAVLQMVIDQGLWALFFLVLIYGLASVWAESGPNAATWGKRLLGLRVETVDHRELTPLRAAVRFVAGSVSWLTLNVGHSLVMFRADRRSLHDLIAGTSVVADPMPPLTRTARAWGCVLLAMVLLWLPLPGRYQPGNTVYSALAMLVSPARG